MLRQFCVVVAILSPPARRTGRGRPAPPGIAAGILGTGRSQRLERRNRRRRATGSRCPRTGPAPGAFRGAIAAGQRPVRRQGLHRGRDSLYRVAAARRAARRRREPEAARSIARPGLRAGCRAGNTKRRVPPLERALLIDRRSYGLYDIGQQMLLRQLADSLVKLGRPEDAQRHLGYLLQLGERVYGRHDPRQVPILCFVANWYADYGDFITARAIYRGARNSSRRSSDRTTPQCSSRCGRWRARTRRSSFIRRSA